MFHETFTSDDYQERPLIAVERGRHTDNIYSIGCPRCGDLSLRFVKMAEETDKISREMVITFKCDSTCKLESKLKIGFGSNNTTLQWWLR